MTKISGRWGLWVEKHNKVEGVPMILHIGMEKTGSKAYQNWMHSNRKELCNNGWWVPSLLGEINHRKISFLGYDITMKDDGTSRRGIRTSKELKLFKQKIVAEVKKEVSNCLANKCKAMIASTELASSRLIRTKSIDRMLSKLKTAGIGPILIVLFRRDPVEIMESRQGTAIMWEGCTRRHPPRPGSRKADIFCDQVALIKRWEKVSNRSTHVDLDVHWYDKQTLINDSITDTIQALIGCKIEEKEILERKNISLPLINQELLRRLNKISNGRKQAGAWEKKFRNFLIDKPIMKKIRYKISADIARKYARYYSKSLKPEEIDLLDYSTWNN